MDNTKLAWLAGLVDGEGSMGMYAQTYVPKNARCKKSVRYQVTIANDNTEIILEASRLMEEITGRPAFLASATNHRSFVHYKLSVMKINDCIKVLNAIEPYLVGKKAQAQVMLKVLKNHHPHIRYTRAELDVINILKSMKDNDKDIVSDNTEPSREKSRASVEHIEEATQTELNLG